MPPLLLAAATGLLSGLILSIPIGPVNLTILNEGARRGFKYAALVGLGGSIMDIIYCGIAFTGFSNFFHNEIVKATMEVLSFLFIIFLGIKFMTATSVPQTGRIGHRMEERLHPHSAFMTGFVRVLGNPGLLGGWIVLSGSFLAHDLVQPTWRSKAACMAGVLSGTCIWFCVLSYGVSLGRHKFSERTLVRMEKISGLGLLLFGIGYGCRIIWQLAKAKHGG